MDKSIMIVDDSASMRMALTTTLQSNGYQVIEAADGKDALARLDIQINLVLTDLIMPAMGGIELIRAIRAMPSYTSLPILILSTEDRLSEKKAAQEAGATGWIVKPFNASQLIAAIEKVLQ